MKGPKGDPEKIVRPAGTHSHITWQNYAGKDGPINITDAGETDFNKISIVDCKDQAFVFPGKVQAILVDNCSKVQIQVEKVISGVEIVNSDKTSFYVQKSANTIAIDGCQGAHVYLWDEAKGADIVTSKSSEMNCSVQVDDEFKEMAIPEQFVSKWDPKAKKIVTSVTEQIGV